MSSVRDIKRQSVTWAETYHVPSFWMTDWLLYVLGQAPLFLITNDNYVLNHDEQARFDKGVVQIQAGTPLAYLTGTQAFWSLDFQVNEHTLIPRPDTEVLVEQVLAWMAANPTANAAPRLLDLGTGSGCIAISLAYELQQAQGNRWQVTAVDMSTGALAVAKQNAALNKVTNVTFAQGSWYDALDDTDARFEVIVSNPPYIDEADAHLAQLIAEPISALSAPNHGLADIEHIVAHAPQHLQTGGLLAIEHGYDQGVAVADLMRAWGFNDVHTVQDYGGRDRVTMGQYVTV
ncbi:peptide chain release factor N(5)-glutamine methyltransferase [Psychrobacter aestuarii]|uniref:Release factor glutamine methyltransferase n=1 Tax=Psychrobacter aestuarii TaxID=556327 RepID=A0ABN0VPA1_9GAMM|nr:peptide chain release factor N(5)-glutamine methyltransferase [Psychrobacter aestuarii]